MGWDGTGRGVGWDGMGWDGTGWDGGAAARPLSRQSTPSEQSHSGGALGCPSSRCGIYGGGQAGHTTWPSRPLLGGALFPLAVTQPPHNPKAFIIGKG